VRPSDLRGVRKCHRSPPDAFTVDLKPKASPDRYWDLCCHAFGEGDLGPYAARRKTRVLGSGSGGVRHAEMVSGYRSYVLGWRACGAGRCGRDISCGWTIANRPPLCDIGLPIRQTSWASQAAGAGWSVWQMNGAAQTGATAGRASPNGKHRRGGGLQRNQPRGAARTSASKSGPASRQPLC